MEDSGSRKNGYTVWRCQCSCGGEIALDTRALQRGAIQNCGCMRIVKKDLTGQRFGRLKVMAVEPVQKGPTLWRCRCDCGNETIVPTAQLTSGNKKSCGCLAHPPRKEFVGKRFGKLLVTDYAGKRAGMHRWKCLCDCGMSTVVGQTLLQTGKTKSCGCIQAQVVLETMKFIDGTSVTKLEKTGTNLISTNSSGHTGVYYNKQTHKWIAQIGFKGKNIYLGSYKELLAAKKVRQSAEQRIYGEFLANYYMTQDAK